MLHPRTLRKGMMTMVTYSDLFAFVIMLYAVISLMIILIREKQRPHPDKIRRYFSTILPGARYPLASALLLNIL